MKLEQLIIQKEYTKIWSTISRIILMYINTLRQHILISGVTILLTVWIFLLLAHIFDKQIEKDYPDLMNGDIFVEKKIIDERTEKWDIKKNLKSYVKSQLVQEAFSWFVSKPYSWSSNDVNITTWNYSFTWDLIVESLPIKSNDPLDQHIDNFLASYNDTEYQIHKKPFILSSTDYGSWTWIHLFKNAQDLTDMWYTIVSHRVRENYDKSYRRHNISTALKEFWSVRVVNPWEVLSFIDEINYDPQEQELYKNWFTVVLDEDQTEYWWGLCGASTALYQWLLTNKAILPAEWRAHTQRYWNLYDAQVNGETITMPWLDSTIYDGHIDYKIENTANYPIIVVSNYDGSFWWIEEVFSLAKTEDWWDFEHKYAWPNRATVIVDGIKKTVRGWCYGRIINWEERESCYKQVN